VAGGRRLPDGWMHGDAGELIRDLREAKKDDAGLADIDSRTQEIRELSMPRPSDRPSKPDQFLQKIGLIEEA